MNNADTIPSILGKWGARIMTSGRASQIDGSILVSVTEASSSWIYRCRPPVSVEQVSEVKEDLVCAIRFRSYAFDRLVTYDLTLQQAMLHGDFVVEGDPSKAMTFFSLVCSGGACD